MTQNDFSAEMLKQNGIKPGAVPLETSEQLGQRIAGARRSARRTKIMAIFLWAATVFCVIVLPRLLMMGRTGSTDEWAMGSTVRSIAGAIASVLAMFAILYSVLWYVRWRAATTTELNARLARVEEQLSRIASHDKGS